MHVLFALGAHTVPPCGLDHELGLQYDYRIGVLHWKAPLTDGQALAVQVIVDVSHDFVLLGVYSIVSSVRLLSTLVDIFPIVTPS
jgi:hypothetical protein